MPHRNLYPGQDWIKNIEQTYIKFLQEGVAAHRYKLNPTQIALPGKQERMT